MIKIAGFAMSDLAKIIVAGRKTLGWTQHELSTASQVNRSAVAKMETGDGSMDAVVKVLGTLSGRGVDAAKEVLAALHQKMSERVVAERPAKAADADYIDARVLAAFVSSDGVPVTAQQVVRVLLSSDGLLGLIDRGVVEPHGAADRRKVKALRADFAAEASLIFSL